MAKITVIQGLNVSLDNDYANAALNACDAMGVSDFGTLLAATTSIAAATNKDVNAFTSTSRTSSSVQTSIGDWGTGEANFAITTITIHRGGVGVFTDVYGGIDGQSLTKNSDFALKITLTDTRTSG